ncbi:MAG: type sorting protein [Bacteroidota bacterium]|nr:type sorting protein [Bacteroidota bacterium]
MKFTSSLLIALLLVCLVSAQQPQWQNSFSTQKSFIENKSQFNGRDLLPGSEVLFATAKGPCQVLFTKNGLTYRFDKKVTLEEDEPVSATQQERDKFTWQTQVIHMQWQNANSNVQLVPDELVADYQNYTVDNKSLDHVKAYKKLLYKNLYPGIDVQYEFHSGGIKYSIILQPGADPSMIKMDYSDPSNMLKDFNLFIPTIFGNITDMAPNSYYADQSKPSIPTSFVFSDKHIISFDLAPYDHSQQVTIDPWVYFPDSLPNSHKAFYIKTDLSGNAYVYGGDVPFRLMKFDANGVLQWTYNTPWDSATSWFGAVAVDPAGNSYITAGSTAQIAKITPSGIMMWIHNPASSYMEYWAPSFTPDYSRLFVGGSDYNAASHSLNLINGYVFEINLNNGDTLGSLFCASDYFDSTQIFYPFPVPNEVRTLCASPNGNFYFLTQDTIGALDTNFNILFRQYSLSTLSYYPPFGLGGGQGQNAMAVSGNYIYTSNGNTLLKRFILTGDIIDAVPIPHGLFQLNYGLAVDSCENVYVGSQKHVYKYDFLFRLVDSASTPGPVYDVSVGPNGNVFACGDSFAMAVNLFACSSHLTVARLPIAVNVSETGTNCSSACTGSLAITPESGTPPFRYLWGPTADTTSTITGLCQGIYTLTITDAANYSATLSYAVTQTPGPVQQLCMVTADSNSVENIVIWEKLNKYLTDSFYLYRAPTPDTTYVLIAGLNRDSLSEYIDTGANPDLMSYRYKINLKDTCNDFSAFSNYHQTIFLTDSGQGVFTWIPYQIENTPNAATSYDLYRDSISNGNWQLIAGVAGNITTATDPNYAHYSNARYKVVAILNSSCTPSRSGSSTVTSNIINALPTGLTNSSVDGEIKVFPNPNNGVFTLKSTGLTGADYTVYDLLGNTIIKASITTNRQTINLNTAPSGVYLLLIKGQNISKALRITVER